MPRRHLGTGKREHVRHRSRIALVLIDVLNEFDFPEARQLLRGALPMARKLAKLAAHFRGRRLPVIYCNDNFGQWKSDRSQVIHRAVDSDCPGREVAAMLLPEEDDYFVLKPKHSAFYSTTLETLLADLGVDTLVFGGVAGNICVLHTAYDAHVRGYSIVIPRDCIASNTVKDQAFALDQFRKVLAIDTRPAEQWWKSFVRGRVIIAVNRLLPDTQLIDKILRMLPPLIVSSNEPFLNRIQSESNSKALITNSYVQGLRWISDPSVPISGIYLNPNDSSYSAIKFLAISLIQRPATPTFIIDEEGGLTQHNFSCLADKFRIQKAFKGELHFKDLLQGLQTEIPDGLRAVQSRGVATSRYPGYIAVPVIDFIHSKKYPFNVFVEDESGELRFFAMEESEVDLEYLTFLSKKTSVLHVEAASIQSRRDSFQFVENAYLDPDYLSPSWRSAETLYRTRVLLTELRNNGVSDEVLDKTYKVIEELFLLVSQLSRDAYLRKFVDQARQCDRAVSCATLATLMCKKLRFETTTATESLGLASFFQDISLYNSPFGDLSTQHPSTLSPAALEFYFNHPIASAVLVSTVESIPEVTRQIIRQHHERADRTGFPNGVGGAQLQPLAEVLSLINAYIDHQDGPEKLEEKVFSHYSGMMVVAFKELLTALGKPIE